MSILIPCTSPATVADLKRGDWAAMFPHTTELQRIFGIVSRGDCIRVTWDHGPGTRAWVRVIPGKNPVQRQWS